ncbi:MAG: NIPSNAP family protein [Actinobacteria bacterium]|nr:NIPSNAP family protein [Actinomycetota bacterium]
MELYLRIYEIRPGEMAAWLEEWRAHVLPVRRRLGFEVLGAWASEEASTFTWLLGYERPDGFEAANAAYYASPEHAAFDPDPARHIAAARQLPVRALDL